MILRRYKRKYFWPIGLITLGIIPLLFFRHIGTDPRYHTQRTMEINMPFPDFFKWVKLNDPEIDIPPHGNWKIYSFTEDEALNEVRLSTLTQDIKQFMIRQEKNWGIQIRLNRNMTYERFVKIIDMLNLTNVTRFTIWNSNVWIHKFPRKTKITNESYITICGGCIVPQKSINPSCAQRLKQSIRDYYQYFKAAFSLLPFSVDLVLFLFLIMNIFQIINKRLAT